MSDDNSTAVEDQKKKRGRQPKADKGGAKEAKKRGRSATEKTANNTAARKSDNEDNDTGSAPAKRGRGRPKKKVYLIFFKSLFSIYSYSLYRN